MVEHAVDKPVDKPVDPAIKEIKKLIADGKSIKEISKILIINYRTVLSKIKKNNLSNKPKYSSRGRPYGSYDSYKRTRKKKILYKNFNKLSIN